MRILAGHLAVFVAAWVVCSSVGYQGVSKHLLLFSGGGSTGEKSHVIGKNQDEKPQFKDEMVEARTIIKAKRRKWSRFKKQKDSQSTDGGKITIKARSTWSKIREQGSDIRKRFLDRIALTSSALLNREMDAVLDESNNEDPTAITPQSDLSLPGRHMCIVTTAALPWMTGTAVNPLLRAAYLCRKTKQINNGQGGWVSLVIPWLELEEDRAELYGTHKFDTPADQENFIRNWLRDGADMADVADDLKLIFYPARYHSGLKSIFAMGDILSLIDDRDVCVLEEPEHLNWYRAPGTGWTSSFNYVIGIVHTNYKEYASSQYHGLWTAPVIAVLSSAMVRAYCHKVIKLSDVLQTFAPEKESTSNTHGVRSDFLAEGQRRGLEGGSQRGVYFIGKLLWAKGFDLMLDLQEYYKQCTGDYFAINIYGDGPDRKDIIRAYHGRKNVDEMEVTLTQVTEPIQVDDGSIEEVTLTVEEELIDASTQEILPSDKNGRLVRIRQSIRETTESLEFDLPKRFYELRRTQIPASFPGRIDHSALKEEYSIFVNPSVSEVLCTTTAEALAMGKFVVIPVHPSNTFFLRFPNCLAYRNKFEFVANLRWAMLHEPDPLTPELAHEFTWEAATERFMEAATITFAEAKERERLGRTKFDERIAWFHNELGKGNRGDTIRKVLGAGPASQQVRYQQQRDGDEDDEEGFGGKFLGSSLAAAIRSTVSNGLPSLKLGGNNPVP